MKLITKKNGIEEGIIVLWPTVVGGSAYLINGSWFCPQGILGDSPSGGVDFTQEKWI